MKRSTGWLLAAGVLLFAGEIVSHSLPAVYATLAIAGWGLLFVTLFHLVPLVVDAAAIRVLLPARSSWRDTVLARWAGESASSLLPFGQLAGPVVMIQQLWRRGVLVQNAVAAVTVSTTLQVLAQIAFALLGLAMIAGQVSPHAQSAVRPALLVAGIVLAVPAPAPSDGQCWLPSEPPPRRPNCWSYRRVARLVRYCRVNFPGETWRLRRACSLRNCIGKSLAAQLSLICVCATWQSTIWSIFETCSVKSVLL